MEKPINVISSDRFIIFFSIEFNLDNARQPRMAQAHLEILLKMIINHGELDETKKLNGVGMKIIFDQEKGAQLW